MADQLAFHQVLTETHRGRLGEELEREREVRRRHEAIESMRAASRSLGLPDERAPSAQEYRQAARQTTLPMSFDAVHGAFDGRWGLARDAYDGVPVPKTAAQRAIARQVHRPRSLQDAIAGLQAFLAEMPEDVPPLQTDYLRWAREHNERLARREARGRRVIEGAGTLQARLLLPWEQMLAVARGEVTPAQARAQAGEAILDACELASHAQVQVIFGEAHPEEWPGFPDPLPLVARRWWRDDLRAYMAGKRFTSEDNRASRARYKAGRTREEREAWGAEVIARERRLRERAAAEAERLERGREEAQAEEAAQARSGVPREVGLSVPPFGGRGREAAQAQPRRGRARARAAETAQTAQTAEAREREREERAWRRARQQAAAEAERQERALLRAERREAAKERAAAAKERAAAARERQERKRRGAQERERERRRRAEERAAAKAERQERARLQKQEREAARARAAAARERKERKRRAAQEQREADERAAVRARVTAWLERERQQPRGNRELIDELPEGWEPPKRSPRRYGKAHR